MISNRPWKIDESWGISIDAPHGYSVIPSCSACDKHEDDLRYIVACVNAFDEAGILPADLKAFVEAVRLGQKLWNFAFDTGVGPQPVDAETLGSVRIEAMKSMCAAAALLPEARKG